VPLGLQIALPRGTPPPPLFSNAPLCLPSDLYPLLTVTFSDQTGATNHREIILRSSLTPTHPTGLQKDLRAYCSFDKNFDNQTPLGDRINAIPHGGATQNETGIRGSALKLQRDQNQYLEVNRSILDDNADQYTVSAWIKPSALPDHGHSDRHSVLESFVNNHCQLPQASSSGCGISVGLRSGATPMLSIFSSTPKHSNPHPFHRDSHPARPFKEAATINSNAPF
jgi:hypothetical protein